MAGWMPGVNAVPGPMWKQGYPSYPSPQAKEGFVLHSMEGSYLGAYAELQKPTREASWHFSVGKNGAIYQHYDIRAVCWHCGLPGDTNPLTSVVGNVALIGIEHEGVAGEPLTPFQVDSTLRIQRWCYSVLPSLKSPKLHSSHWEHGWVSSTSCPSGRIPWAVIMAGLQEDKMASAEYTALLAKITAQEKRLAELEQDKKENVQYVQFAGKPAVYSVIGNELRHEVNWASFSAHADEKDPMTVRKLVKGTPEFAQFKSFSVSFKTVPDEMSG